MKAQAARGFAALSTAALAGLLAASVAPVFAAEKDPAMSTPSHMPFEQIAQRLLRCRPTVADVSAALGGPAAPPAGDVSFRLAQSAAPFAAATIHQSALAISVVFDFTPGSWRFGDVVAEPESWRLGPRLPDSGVLEVQRAWDGEHREVTCIVRVEGDGPAATLVVQGQARCRISTF